MNNQETVIGSLILSRKHEGLPLTRVVSVDEALEHTNANSTVTRSKYTQQYI